jgi:hypothetical protein
VSRRTRAARRRRKDLLGLVLLGVALAALGGLAGAAILFRTPPYEAATLCLQDRPAPQHIFFLVDATDRLEARHAARLERAVQEEIARAPRWSRFSIAMLDGNPDQVPNLLFSACDPGDRASASALWENVSGLEEDRRTRFAAPLKDALSALRRARPLARSPLVEGLAALASGEHLHDPRNRPTTLVLVSDLLQFAPGFSLYGEGSDWAAYRASTGAVRTAADLRGVSVRVLVLERPDKGEAQDRAKSAFWTPYR